MSDTLTIVYEVDGTSGVGDISYREPDGTMQLLDDAELPWRLGFTARPDGQPGNTPHVSVLMADVTSDAADSGELTCRITVDGEVAVEYADSLQAMCIAEDTLVTPPTTRVAGFLDRRLSPGAGTGRAREGQAACCTYIT